MKLLPNEWRVLIIIPIGYVAPITRASMKRSRRRRFQKSHARQRSSQAYTQYLTTMSSTLVGYLHRPQLHLHKHLSQPHRWVTVSGITMSYRCQSTYSGLEPRHTYPSAGGTTCTLFRDIASSKNITIASQSFLGQITSSMSSIWVPSHQSSLIYKYFLSYSHCSSL